MKHFTNWFYESLAPQQCFFACRIKFWSYGYSSWNMKLSYCMYWGAQSPVTSSWESWLSEEQSTMISVWLQRLQGYIAACLLCCTKATFIRLNEIKVPVLLSLFLGEERWNVEIQSGNDWDSVGLNGFFSRMHFYYYYLELVMQLWVLTWIYCRNLSYIWFYILSSSSIGDNCEYAWDSREIYGIQNHWS